MARSRGPASPRRRWRRGALRWKPAGWAPFHQRQDHGGAETGGRSMQRINLLLHELLTEIYGTVILEAALETHRPTNEISEQEGLEEFHDYPEGLLLGCGWLRLLIFA